MLNGDDQRRSAPISEKKKREKKRNSKMEGEATFWKTQKAFGTGALKCVLLCLCLCLSVCMKKENNDVCHLKRH